MWRRVLHTIWVVSLTAMVASVLVNFDIKSPAASAAQAVDFDPGYIVSDQNFYNGSAMSEAEIQSFLSSKVSCSNSNCLPNYRADTPTRTWSWGTCGTYDGGTAESAARIIYKVQVACGLSARAILVTLQKEQSLVTSSAPSDLTMRKAMGFGCPDTSVCDSTYYGFFNQVFAAARQLTWYGNSAGSFTYIRLGQSNEIRYSPDANCGTQSVLVRNRATAALYYYTPYTPNAAAMSNLYGIGDSCSAYGNRNFWRMYTDWFGTPTGGVGEVAIAAKYAEIGGASSLLGPATTSVSCGYKNGGCFQLFQGGLILYSTATGAQTMSGLFHAAWGTQGYENGWLGYPTSPTACGLMSADPAGCWQTFQGGVVIYSPATGAQVMKSSVHAAWGAQGYENGWLGFPTSPTVCSMVGGGCWQLFQGGLVVVSPSGSAQSMRPSLHAAWGTQGYENGWLGYPTGSSVSNGAGGFTQSFQGGSITVDSSGNATSFDGANSSVSVQVAFANSRIGSAWLGSKVTSVVCGARDGGCWQLFQGGLLMYSPATGVHQLSPVMHAAWGTQGYENGWLGYPTGSVSVNGAGISTQTFQGGSVSIDATGAVTFSR